MSMMNFLQKVAVLMAAYNVVTWLSDQLNSILNQTGVDVVVFVLDVFSTDANYGKLKNYSI